jgi:hypothetical protein
MANSHSTKRLVTHALLALAAAAVLPFTLGASVAHARQITLAVSPAVPETIVLQHFGWAEQEFAKVNTRVRYAAIAPNTKTTVEATRLVLEAQDASPDMEARVEKVVARAARWIERNPETAKAILAAAPVVANHQRQHESLAAAPQ